MPLNPRSGLASLVAQTQALSQPPEPIPLSPIHSANPLGQSTAPIHSPGRALARLTNAAAKCRADLLANLLIFLNHHADAQGRGIQPRRSAPSRTMRKTRSLSARGE